MTDEAASANRVHLEIEWLDGTRRECDVISWEGAEMPSSAPILHFSDHAVLLPLVGVREITFR